MKLNSLFHFYVTWILNYPMTAISQKVPSLLTNSQKAILEKFGLANATRKDAVPDLIKYIEDQKKLGLKYDKMEDSHHKHHKGKSHTRPIGSNDHLPICNVTYSSSIHKGSFQFNINITKPRYDQDCYLRRVRYHSAPVCQEEDRLKGLVPLYTFEWKMKPARDDTVSKKAVKCLILIFCMHQQHILSIKLIHQRVYVLQ